MTRATIIGGGVVGLVVAREIAGLFDEVYLIEKEKRFGEHASGRNSGVNHAGIYYPSNSLKTALCVKGNILLREFCNRYKVPYLDVGKIIVAINSKEESELESILNRGIQNNVPDLKLISGNEAKKLEHNIVCSAALHVPTSGIIDTISYLQTLSGMAQAKGVQFVKKTKVTDIISKSNQFTVFSKTGAKEEEYFTTDFIINAAGLYGDDIARMVNPENNYKIIPVRGEAAKFNKSKKTELNISMNVYPLPHQHLMTNGEKTYTVGVHLTPTLNEIGISNAITIGPLLVNSQEKEDYRLTTPLFEFYQKVYPFFPSLNINDLEYHQAGVSAKLSGFNDFIIQKDRIFPQCIHIMGIDSPGLTSSLAIGLYVKDILISNFGF